MIKLRKTIANIFISIGLSCVFAFFMIFVSPRFLFLGDFYSAKDTAIFAARNTGAIEINYTHRFIIGVFLFLMESLFASILMTYFSKRISAREYNRTYTKLFADFLERLRFCYTHENLIDAVRDNLEIAANCSVIIFNSEDTVVYNSSAVFVSMSETFIKFKEACSDLKDGVYFFDDNFKFSGRKKARLVIFIRGDIRFCIVCRFLKEVEPEIISILFAEFKTYLNRVKTLEKLLQLSQLSQEWNMVSQTQRSFLPKEVPNIRGLEIGAYFKPLVNVSGDYYDFVKISETKTLFVTGDVSGKGLAAALVMGVVVNTIKIAENKEDLAALVRLVDSAIKRMNLQDKYTVLFLGIIDTENMIIRYVNASMESPMILTEAPEGYRIKTLDSTCSIVGIIEMENITVAEKPLYRGDLLLMLSDGVPEVMNSEGIELGETKFYMDSIKNFASLKPQKIVESIADMALSYSANSIMRDDVTIVGVKIKG